MCAHSYYKKGHWALAAAKGSLTPNDNGETAGRVEAPSWCCVICPVESIDCECKDDVPTDLPMDSGNCCHGEL